MLRAVVLAARLRVHDRRADPRRDRRAPARDCAQRAGAAARGVLQDSALGARRRGVPPAARDGAAEGDHAGARRRARLRCGGRSSSLDRYRARFEAAPETLTNAILAGTLLQPLGLVGRRRDSPPTRSSGGSSSACCRSPRRDVERLQQIIALQPRLLDIQAPPAPSAACCTARRSTKRSPGSRFTASGPSRRALARSCRRRPHQRRITSRATVTPPTSAGAPTPPRSPSAPPAAPAVDAARAIAGTAPTRKLQVHVPTSSSNPGVLDSAVIRAGVE